MFNKKQTQQLKEKIEHQEQIILSKNVEIFSLKWQLDELNKRIEKQEFKKCQ